MEVAISRRVELAGARFLPLLFSAAIFWSAALLFWIEPLVSKQLLPLLGGSPGVWNTCLVFFQAMLLAGYGFAHLIAARLNARRAVRVYLGVLAAAALALVVGVTSPAIGREPGAAAPIPWLLLTLLGSVGLPFFALAATGPTLQRWFSLTAHPSARDPYFLYAASNLGSMVGLLAFPTVLEPLVATSRQVGQWTAGYLALLALAIACAATLARWSATAISGTRSRPAAAAAEVVAASAEVVGWRRRARWLLLAAAPSSLLLGVTTYLSTDIAAVPLLWVIPLALYLATFTLTFAARPPIPRRAALIGLPIVAAAWLVSIPVRGDLPYWSLLLLQLLVLFAAAMACHGELARSRPGAQRLTEFYLWVSLGGVLGGAFNALVAPLLFTGTTEYPLALLLAILLLPNAPRRAPRALSWALDLLVPAAALALAVFLFGGNRGGWWSALAAGAPAILALALATVGRPLRLALALGGIYVAAVTTSGDDRPLFAHRDFYGRIRVLAIAGGHGHELMHGTTLHGKQNLLPAYRHMPLTYYSRRGPVGQIFAAVQGRARGAGAAARVAAVGLGTGTLAAYALPGERWTFYELNPAVVRVARDPRLFTYLSDAYARPAVLLGDARLRMRDAPPAAYDLIVLDAFSSDAIPVHLLTREAIRMYVQKLAPGGLIAFNISNRFLDLEPVMSAAARENGLVAWYRDDEKLSSRDEDLGIDRSEWAVLARRREDLGPVATDRRWAPLPPTRLRPWTDDFSGLLPIVQW